MYRLVLLGPPQVLGATGPLKGRARQPRPMALLSMLAVAGSHGCTREQLVTLLWGEIDEGRARRHLSDTLYILHHELGFEVIAVAGSVLHLNRDVVSSDVDEFCGAIERRDYDQAVRLYAGPFLDGFHVVGAPPMLEEWLEEERRRLRQLYIDALEVLARAAEQAGDFSLAVHWWRMLEAQDPLNSRVAIALARDLAAAGDRGNAIKVLLAHCELLRNEVGVDAGHDIREAIEEVRDAKPVPVRKGDAPAIAPLLTDHPPAAPRERRLRRPLLLAGAVAIVALVALVARIAQWPGRTQHTPDPDVFAVLPFRVLGGAPELEDLALHMPDLLWTAMTGEFGPRVADPTNVISRWRSAGGSLGAPLADKEALAIARRVGAGRLVIGAVAGTRPRMRLSASVLELPSGAVRVRSTSVEGAYDSFPVLADRLINQLLAKDYGAAIHNIPQLGEHPTAAVHAFLSGVRDARHHEGNAYWFARAFELDTTLVLAALAAYRADEADHAMARHAWERRDQLSPRDRALLVPLAGWRFGESRSQAERVAQYLSVVRLAPEWEAPLYEWAELLFLWGRSMGVTEWASQMQSALERVAEINPDLLLPWSRLFSLAAYEGDTTAARRYADEYARRAPQPGTSAPEDTWATSWVVRLRLALLRRDSAGAARLWTEGEQVLGGRRRQQMGRNSIYGPGIGAVIGGLLVDGRGLPALDRFVAAMLRADSAASFPLLSWARARGRYREWRALRDALYDALPPITAAGLRVRDALFLGEPEDSAVQRAAAFLEQVVRGTIEPPPDPADPTPDLVGPARARCWSALWRIAHADLGDARGAVRYLRALPLPYRWATCAGLIEVLVAEQEGRDVRAALLRLDETVRPVPAEVWPFEHGARDLTLGIDNLVLARRLANLGDTARALAAARRGPWGPSAINRAAHWRLGMLPDYLREEARLAALTGDTAGAVRAYRHYHVVRGGAEAPWRDELEAVRHELAALVGRER